MNAYYAGTSNTAGTITFSAAGAGNRVTGVRVKWSSLATEYGVNYPLNASTPIANRVSGTSYFTVGSLATAVTNFTYRVATTHEDGTPIINYEMAQVYYTADFADAACTDFYSAPNYLWWRFKVPPCPTVNSEQISTNNFQYSYYADGASQYASGNIYLNILNIGSFGERIDDLENPAVDFFVRFNSKGRNPGYNSLSNNLTGITEAEGLAFLSGAFTAMPKLSGWIFTYDTNQRSGVTWTVPNITAAEGQAVQIPLNSGEHFTSLSMTYPGVLNTAHASETDTVKSIYLMKNIMMTALNTNPNTGEELNTTSPYTASFVQLHGYAHWDNCNEESQQHTHTTANHGQQIVFPGIYSQTDYIYPPQIGIYFTRQARLAETTTVVMLEEIASVYQGSCTTGSFRFTIQGTEYPVNTGAHTAGQYRSFGLYVNMPWQSIQEAIYLELTDPELLPNLSTCSLYGVPVSSGNVSAATVTIAGKTYLKLQFVEGFQRTQSLFYPYTGKYSSSGFSGNYYSNYAGWYNAAGIVEVTFSTLPGTTTGLHYPIGDVYLDFTELLTKYDAPNVLTGYDNDRTNWLIAGNADLSELTGGEKPDANKLFRYSFAEGSASPYAVEVIKAQSVGASIVPGKNTIEYDFSDRITDFWGDEREDLNALISITGSLVNNIYDMSSYITIPRAGTSVPYVDGGGVSHSAMSSLSLYLKNAPVILSDTTGLSGNIHFSYTTDPAPSASSTYSSTAPTTPEGWAAVTGIKVTVDTLTAESAVNLRLDLSSDEKTSLGELNAYSAGTFQYKTSPTDEAYAYGNLPLIRWVYKDYTVNQPNGFVFWDTYDENGIQSANIAHGESFVAGITLELLDTDGQTVIDTAVTNSNGQFSLRSYKSDAGQSIRITMPTNAGTTVKLTKQSALVPTASATDSDFNRETNLLTLSKLTKNGLANISAGLVKLPQIEIADQSFVLGQTPTPYSGTLTEYLGMKLPASPTYRLRYDTPADTDIVSFSPYIAPNVSSKVTPNVHYVGSTTARVWVTNILGDVVEATYRISVTTSYSDIIVEKNWEDNLNALATRPSGVTLQLQRSISGGEAQNVGSPVSVSAPWTYTFSHLPDYDAEGNEYTYSVVEYNTDPNYEASYSSDDYGPVVTNALRFITVSGVKTWNELGAGFTRPSEITVHLYRDGVLMTPAADYTRVVTAADADPFDPNRWLYSFSGLLEYNPLTGEKYVYTVQEDPLPAGSNYNGEAHGMDVTNMYPAKTYFTVEKIWDHGALPEALRPASAEISLYRDGVLFTGELTTKWGPTPGTVVLNGTEATPWTYTFEVAREDAEGHIFSIVETPIAGYTAAVGAMTSDPDDPYHVSCELTNRYTPAPVDYTVRVNKAVTGELPAGAEAKEFVFTLMSLVAGQPMPGGTAAMSVSNSVNGAGEVLFASIRFTRAGEYLYSIQETDFSSDPQYRGYTFDNTVYALKVTVEDELGNGVLAASATLSRPDDTVMDTPWTIENEYRALPAAYTLGVNKALSGDALLPETFNFLLTGSGAAPMPAGDGDTVSIAGEGYAAFGQIMFEQAGDYIYTIRELVPDAADMVEGYSYSSEQVTVTITVTDVGGQLTAAANIANDGIVITNTFEMPRISVSGEKIWIGYFGGSYPAALINLWQNVPVPAEGDLPYATFDIINGGTSYSFTDLPKYDESGELIVYTVTETPIDGVYTRQDGYSFTNIEITPAAFSISAQKLLDGAAPAGGAYAFHLEQTGYLDDSGTAQTFTAYSDDTVNSGKDIAFGEITYTKSGTYIYRITEVPGADTGILYDSRAYDVTVVLVMNTDTAVLTVDSVSYRLEGAAADSDAALFENYTYKYKPVAPAEADPLVQKVVTGDARITESEFTFVLAAQNANTPMPDNAMGGTKTLTLTGNNSGEFGAITYTVPGTYIYTISEVNTSVAGYIYDIVVYTMTILVSSDGEGNLSAVRTLTKAGEAAEAVIFTNEFVQPKGTLTIRKTVSGEGVPADDAFTFTVLFSNSESYAYTGSSAGIIASGGTVSLKHGECIEISGLPVGLTYSIVEDAKPNYTPSPSSCTISGAISQTPSVAEFVNAYLIVTPSGNLTVSKLVTGDLSSQTTDFTFSITLDASGSYNYVKGTQTGLISSGDSFTLRHGESITIYALPEGTSYSIKETDSHSHHVTSTGAQGTITTLNNHAVFLNTRSSVPKTGDEQNNLPLLILLAVSLTGFACSAFAAKKIKKKTNKRV